MFISSSPEIVNIILFRKTVFTGIIKRLKMGLKFNNWYPYKRHKEVKLVKKKKDGDRLGAEARGSRVQG
jgi:hypothetical protein